MEHGRTYVTGREQCPKCAALGNDNSCDNLARYDDGHGYCYACEYYERGEGTVSEAKPVAGDWTPVRSGEYQDIPERRLEEKTLRKYGYSVVSSEEKGEIHIANFYNDGALVAQKFRKVEDKTFAWRGNARSAGLFGQHLFEGKGSKRIVITEGEIDAMSVFQANGGWPVVSLNGGVGNAVNNIKDNLEWISRFPEVILMFDMDDAGREAAAKCADLLPPGRVKIAQLPHKDANEALVNNDSKSIVSACFQAKVHSPDEILHVRDIEVDENARDQEVYGFPWDGLSEYLVGQRSGELTLWCSGTGSGKSTILREIAHGHLEEGRKVGMIMLEESPSETRDDMISLMINKPVRALRAQQMMNELRAKLGKDPLTVTISSFDEDEYNQAKAELDKTNLFIYDHLGNNGILNIIARMEYMAVSLGVDVIILDHITALAAGLLGSDDQGDERQMIDRVMKDLRALSVRTGVHIDIVSQLKKTDRSYEEGSRITLQDIRGSGSLSSVPNTVIALERNRQADNDLEANTTIVRVLKNRLTGRAGVATALYYDRDQGRLSENEFQIVDGEVRLKP